MNLNLVSVCCEQQNVFRLIVTESNIGHILGTFQWPNGVSLVCPSQRILVETIPNHPLKATTSTSNSVPHFLVLLFFFYQSANIFISTAITHDNIAIRVLIDSAKRYGQARKGSQPHKYQIHNDH